MTSLLTAAVIAAIVGSAMIGGIFFAFSSFIMKALDRLPSPEGMAAMQSINKVILNRSFLGLFMGTAVLSALLLGLAIFNGQAPGSIWLSAGAAAYLLGTFLLTGMGNVPLNERLDKVSRDSAEASEIWALYLQRWTRLNTVRTVMALLAAVFLLVGLLGF
ncbi:MAG: anthrone oxygenase family protein [Halieaceae bacterium]|jgi:uncharacterized membrane protein|nr:anthrone oxygenase family protein [Halieaceae bacterium]